MEFFPQKALKLAELIRFWEACQGSIMTQAHRARMIAVSSERQILSILLGYTYNESGYGRDAKGDYWALLKKAGIQLYDNSATKISAPK